MEIEGTAMEIARAIPDTPTDPKIKLSDIMITPRGSMKDVRVRIDPFLRFFTIVFVVASTPIKRTIKKSDISLNPDITLSGITKLSTDGPRMMPAIISPMTDGYPTFSNIDPSMMARSKSENMAINISTSIQFFHILSL